MTAVSLSLSLSLSLSVSPSPPPCLWQSPGTCFLTYVLSLPVSLSSTALPHPEPFFPPCSHEHSLTCPENPSIVSASPSIGVLLLFCISFYFFWIFEFYLFLYSRFLSVIHFIHISVYTSISISQFITPPPPPPAASPLSVHTFVLYICVSISALQTSSSVPFF